MLIKKQIAGASAAGTYYPLQGSQYEHLDGPAQVSFAIVQDGSTDANLATVYSGSDVLQEQAAIDVKATLIAVWPDDFALQDIAGQGERLSVVVSKVGTTDSILVVVRIIPL